MCDTQESADERDRVEIKPMDNQVGGNHYSKLAIGPAEYCQKNRLNYCESAVIKYVTRHRDKNGAEDIRKAMHFLEMLLELEYGLVE